MRQFESYPDRFPASLLVRENLSDSRYLGKKFLESCVLPNWVAQPIFAGSIDETAAFLSVDHAVRISGMEFSRKEYEAVFSQIENRITQTGVSIGARSGDIRKASLPITEKDLGEIWKFGWNYSDESVNGIFQTFFCRSGASDAILIVTLTESSNSFSAAGSG